MPVSAAHEFTRVAQSNRSSCLADRSRASRRNGVAQRRNAATRPPSGPASASRIGNDDAVRVLPFVARRSARIKISAGSSCCRICSCRRHSGTPSTSMNALSVPMRLDLPPARRTALNREFTLREHQFREADLERAVRQNLRAQAAVALQPRFRARRECLVQPVAWSAMRGAAKADALQFEVLRRSARSDRRRRRSRSAATRRATSARAETPRSARRRPPARRR